MTVAMWLVAGISGVILLVLGMLLGWVWFGPGKETPDWVERKFNSILGVIFSVFALIVTLNVVVVAHQYHDQVACNSEVIKRLQANANARRNVIQADIAVDLAVAQYLDTERHHGGIMPPSAPAVQTLLDAVKTAHQARTIQLNTFVENDYDICERSVS